MVSADAPVPAHRQAPATTRPRMTALKCMDRNRLRMVLCMVLSRVKGMSSSPLQGISLSGTKIAHRRRIFLQDFASGSGGRHSGRVAGALARETAMSNAEGLEDLMRRVRRRGRNNRPVGPRQGRDLT